MTTTSERPTRLGGRPATWSVDEALKLRQEIKPGTNPPRRWTNADLAELFGVKPQAIGQRLNRATGGATKGGSQPEDRLLPWTVAEQHHHYYIPKTLRLLERRNRGEELNQNNNAKVNNFLDGLGRLGDMVIYYDRNDARGFIFRPRRKEDGNRLCVTEP